MKRFNLSISLEYSGNPMDNESFWSDNLFGMMWDKRDRNHRRWAWLSFGFDQDVPREVSDCSTDAYLTPIIRCVTVPFPFKELELVEQFTFIWIGTVDQFISFELELMNQFFDSVYTNCWAWTVIGLVMQRGEVKGICRGWHGQKKRSLALTEKLTDRSALIRRDSSLHREMSSNSSWLVGRNLRWHELLLERIATDDGQGRDADRVQWTKIRMRTKRQASKRCLRNSSCPKWVFSSSRWTCRRLTANHWKSFGGREREEPSSHDFDNNGNSIEIDLRKKMTNVLLSFRFDRTRRTPMWTIRSFVRSASKDLTSSVRFDSAWLKGKNTLWKASTLVSFRSIGKRRCNFRWEEFLYWTSSSRHSQRLFSISLLTLKSLACRRRSTFDWSRSHPLQSSRSVNRHSFFTEMIDDETIDSIANPNRKHKANRTFRRAGHQIDSS